MSRFVIEPPGVRMSDPRNDASQLPRPIAAGYGINRVALLLQQAMERRMLAAGLDLTIEQWAVLLQIFQVREITHGELADRTFRHRTSLTRMIDTLVDKGYVQRTADPQDRRIVQLSLTSEGQSLMMILLPLAIDTLSVALDNVPPDQMQVLIGLLQHIERNLLKDEPGH
jgi:DNA-binding MarR family transcriptional regulator